MSATHAPRVEVENHPRRPRSTGRPHRWRGGTPARLRALAVAAGIATVALLVLVVLEVQRQGQNLRVIGDQTAPVVAAANDLYFALNDMDAQVANVLLVGSTRRAWVSPAPRHWPSTSNAASRPTPTCEQAVGDGHDPETQQAVAGRAGPASGRYEALAAQTILLDGQAAARRRASHGQPPWTSTGRPPTCSTPNCCPPHTA